MRDRCGLAVAIPSTRLSAMARDSPREEGMVGIPEDAQATAPRTLGKVLAQRVTRSPMRMHGR